MGAATQPTPGSYTIMAMPQHHPYGPLAAGNAEYCLQQLEAHIAVARALEDLELAERGQPPVIFQDPVIGIYAVAQVL
jgi:hypothetical protein